MPVHPAQRPAPQKPLVDVAQQYGGKAAVLLDYLEQLPDLAAALTGTQAQMRGDYAQAVAPVRHARIDGAARLETAHAQIPALYLAVAQSREDGVAVLAAFAEQSRPGNRVEPAFPAQVVEHVEAGPAQR